MTIYVIYEQDFFLGEKENRFYVKDENFAINLVNMLNDRSKVLRQNKEKMYSKVFERIKIEFKDKSNIIKLINNNKTSYYGYVKFLSSGELTEEEVDKCFFIEKEIKKDFNSKENIIDSHIKNDGKFGYLKLDMF